MGTSRIRVMLVAGVLAAAGCATGGSLAGKDGSQVYGGTRLDAKIVSESLGPQPSVGKKDGLEPPVLVWAACCGLADMPLSFVADTVLLPVTVPLAMQRHDGEPEPGNDSPKRN
jgi:uncharacterized protein YceK